MLDITKLFDKYTLWEWEEKIISWEIKPIFDVNDNQMWIDRLEEAFGYSLDDTKLDEETVVHWRNALIEKTETRRWDSEHRPFEGCISRIMIFFLGPLIAGVLVSVGDHIFHMKILSDYHGMSMFKFLGVVVISFAIAAVLVMWSKRAINRFVIRKRIRRALSRL